MATDSLAFDDDESDYLMTLSSDQINIFSSRKEEIKIEKYDRRENNCHFTNKMLIYVSKAQHFIKTEKLSH